MTITRDNGRIMGNHNKIKGNNCEIMGNHNNVEGNNNKITGNHNKVWGNHNRVTGNHGCSCGNDNKMTGMHNTVTGDRSSNMEAPSNVWTSNVIVNNFDDFEFSFNGGSMGAEKNPLPIIPSQDDEKHDVELKEGDSDDIACVVCMTKKKTCISEPCNHVSCCIACARVVKLECPICKVKIKSIKRIFL